MIMEIELADAILETTIRYAQIEITGCCNMSCKHCRAFEDEKKHLSLKDIQLVFDFLAKNRDEKFLLGISGGEPFLHPNLPEILSLAKQYQFENITITTNGSLITNNILKMLNDYKFKNLILQVSLDSSNATTHDSFRNHVGSFDKVINLLKNISNYEFISSAVRSTITGNTIDEVDEIVELVYRASGQEITFSFVKPVGAAQNSQLVLTSAQRKLLVQKVLQANEKYKGKIVVSSSDPLRVLLSPDIDQYITMCEDELMLGGCVAGVAAFNVNVNGDVTPCSMMSEAILNLSNCKNSTEFEKLYTQSPIVMDLATRKLRGACASCKYKYLCGGCRAIAKCVTGDYLGEDALCWLHK